jgi:hypothetical protein
MKSLQAEITTWGEERERKKSRKLVFWKFYFNFFLVLTSGRDIKWLWQLFEPSFVKNAFLTLCCSYKKWSHLHIMYYVLCMFESEQTDCKRISTTCFLLTNLSALLATIDVNILWGGHNFSNVQAT